MGEISLGETVTGDTTNYTSYLGEISPDHYYAFEVSAAMSACAYEGDLEISTCGSALDTYLHVYEAATGSELAFGDNTGDCDAQAVLGGPDALLNLDPGSYVILVEGFYSNHGSYTLSLSGVGTCAPTPLPTSVPGMGVVGSGVLSRSYLGKHSTKAPALPWRLPPLKRSREGPILGAPRIIELDVPFDFDLAPAQRHRA
jgi:hypothetical protein